MNDWQLAHQLAADAVVTDPDNPLVGLSGALLHEPEEDVFTTPLAFSETPSH